MRRWPDWTRANWLPFPPFKTEMSGSCSSVRAASYRSGSAIPCRDPDTELAYLLRTDRPNYALLPIAGIVVFSSGCKGVNFVVCGARRDLFVARSPIDRSIDDGGAVDHGSPAREAPQYIASLGIQRVGDPRSEEHTSELQSLTNLVCRLLLEKKKTKKLDIITTLTSC